MTAGASYDPLRLVADVEVLLYSLGVATVAGGGDSALAAASYLLAAMGVDPVDSRTQVQYQVRLVPPPRRQALAATPSAALALARAWDRAGTGRAHTEIHPVTVPIAGVA